MDYGISKGELNSEYLLSVLSFEGSVGIPLGLLMGLIGTKKTLTILGSRILEAEEGMRGGIPISCAPWVILAITFFSAATILISTWVPARKAAKIMPIDALRQTYAVKYKAKSLRINPLVRRFFGYEGELAYKNIKRNGAKGTVITGTIAVSVIMFLTVSFFCDSIKRVNQFDFDLPFQVEASCSPKESEKLREALTRMDGVERVFSGGMIEYRFENKEDQKYTTANADIANPAFLTPEYEKLHVAEMVLVLIDDADFKELLAANDLPEERYFGGTLRGVLLNSFFHDKNSDAVFNGGILGQSLHYDETVGFPPAVEVGDFVKYDENSYIFRMTPGEEITPIADSCVSAWLSAFCG